MYSAIDLIAEKEALATHRTPFVFLGQEIHDVLGPANAFLGADGPQMGINDTQDTTARRMAQFYANGLSSLAFPKHDEWFGADAPMRNPDEGAKRYYHEVAEEMRLMLEESNFYDTIPTTLFEGGAYGTGLMKIAQDDRDQEAYFAHQCFGTYYIVEDHRQRLAGVYRDVKLTVDQLLGFLGDGTKPEDLPQKLKDAYYDPKKKGTSFDFLHVVKRLPFNEVENGKEYADCVIFPESKTALRETTHNFLPFFVRRHARFSNWTYGYGPGWMALEDGHQASEASRLFEAFASRSTFPSVLATGNEEGAIRLGAGQITYIDPTSQTNPQAWANVGDYRSVMELLLSKHKNIESAFSADLFRGLGADSKVYSAMQSNQIERDKNQQLYPSALRLESETGRPMLDSLYQIGDSQGRFPDPPDSVRDWENDKENVFKPRFRLRSRITVSIRQQRMAKLAGLMEMFAPVFEQNPILAQKIDWEEAITDSLRDTGLPESWITEDKKFKAMQKAQAEAEAAQAQAAQAQQMSGALKNMGQGGQEGLEATQAAL